MDSRETLRRYRIVLLRYSYNVEQDNGRRAVIVFLSKNAFTFRGIHAARLYNIYFKFLSKIFANVDEYQAIMRAKTLARVSDFFFIPPSFEANGFN